MSKYHLGFWVHSLSFSLNGGCIKWNQFAKIFCSYVWVKKGRDKYPHPEFELGSHISVFNGSSFNGIVVDDDDDGSDCETIINAKISDIRRDVDNIYGCMMTLRNSNDSGCWLQSDYIGNEGEWNSSWRWWECLSKQIAQEMLMIIRSNEDGGSGLKGDYLEHEDE